MQKSNDVQDILRRGFLPSRGYDYLTNLFHNGLTDLVRKSRLIATRY